MNFHRVNDMGDSEKLECASREIIKFLIENPKFPQKNITTLKNQLMKKYKIEKTIKNSQILPFASEDEIELILPLLRRRSTRSLSGVTVVAVMTKPIDCPGHCLFCPGQDSQPGKKVAKSYTGQEPAAKRSIIYAYNGFLQTRNRLKDLQAIGHKIDKVELICMGGTFLSAPEQYQDEFIIDCYKAINNFSNSDYDPKNHEISLNEAKSAAENGALRLIGITFETRPDYCMPRHINRILNFGGTRVELGVQTTRQSILENLNRGHSINQTIDAFKFAKDSGLKINAHMMPNLPGSTPKQDVEDLINLFENKDFRPDMLKIYPTLVIKGTELHNMWSKGEYKSYSLDQTIDLIAQIKSRLPSYVRIQRIQRDIPAYLIEDGVKKSNLRELVKQHLAQNNKKCNCIRCREQGFLRRTLLQKDENAYLDFESFKLKRLDYEASKGTEIFLSYENDDMLVGYLRLRKPSIDVFRPELRYPDVLIVREIKVVGDVVPHKKRPNSQQVQHRGFGQRLLKKAESIAKNEFDAKKIAVISGIGVREWFYNFSYKIDGYYVSKRLD